MQSETNREEILEEDKYLSRFYIPCDYMLPEKYDKRHIEQDSMRARI